MTHNQIPIVQISRGDLIYGLSKERVAYTKKHKPFRFVNMDFHAKEYDFIPTNIDQYVMPFERVINAGSAARRDFNMNLPKKRPFRDNFKTHMEKHLKYSTAAAEDPLSKYSTTHYSRKCKGGLSWIVTDNDPIAQKLKIHFILDGIDMKSVVKKESYISDKTSITAHELRWIYRNRNNPKVKQKIHFWLDGEPSMPPWERPESRELWKEYIPTGELPQTEITRL
ncbi:hypothetical protein [Xenorhabdus bovienii]|uniref:Uncharacterized protein n=1 Tax=Xenorhabdus bovienii str. Intermedium TaxID=1379677 RepID=A0A077QMS0_XENBV|nr:hypothetical protein [Xenorhabdus bovienii]MDE9456107.1 hypothetical protein [Xenorhabdus bovienii]MDE9484206.1 hypothetical protein [Xenorhabdus bovienii]MDE9545541.1 hypothetical protein [Xenorhabdus bovienii]MDE9566749.1 hypothetical protein [Xenorhabdus bovienii]CDH34623.1 hypothetical protein XBI1_370002 [Xenorhabdus bovienii str. Intermedium]